MIEFKKEYITRIWTNIKKKLTASNITFSDGESIQAKYDERKMEGINIWYYESNVLISQTISESDLVADNNYAHPKANDLIIVKTPYGHAEENSFYLYKITEVLDLHLKIEFISQLSTTKTATTTTDGLMSSNDKKILNGIGSELNDLKTDILKTVFPVGSRYVTQTADENPANILGFGIWERFDGLLAVGIKDDESEFSEIGKIVGEEKHTLSVEEIPGDYWHANARAGDTIRSGFTSNSTGLGANAGAKSIEHNNIQPTKVVGYMWIRKE